MAKPKLALVPAAQGSKFYSVLPSSGVGDFDFTRSGSATRINSQGLIETVGNGVSRLNYPLIDGVVSGCPHHILEPQSTNLIQYSEAFDNTVWEYGGIIKTSNEAISPDGTLNAEKIEITTLSTPNLRQTIGVLPSTKYTFSFYAKSNELSNLKLAVYDLSNAGFIFENEEKLINSQWSRVSVTFTTPSGCNSVRAFIFRNSDTLGSFYVWGGQLEIGYETSYIRNLATGSSTRSAETANGSGDAATFNDSEGVLMAEISALADDGVNKFISISDGTINNRINIVFDTSNNINARQAPGSVNISTSGINILNSNKIAYEYQSGSQELWVNGFKIGETSVSTLPSGLDRLNFDSFNGGDDMYCNTKQIQYFDTALTDSELEQLTSWVSFQEMAESQLYSIE